MLSLNELAVFSEVARAGSFTQAAKHLGLSKASVSEQVGRLERDLGVQLLARTTRRLSLTEAGEACLRHAMRMRDEADAAVRAAARHHLEPIGLLRIACPQTFAEMYLVPAVAGMLEDHPSLSIEFAEGPVATDLIGERFDMAVRIGSLPDSTLAARRIGWSRTGLVAAPAYVERHGGLASFESAEAADALRVLPLQTGESWTLKGQGGAVRELSARTRFTANSGASVRQAACAGLGMALLPGWMIAPDLRAGRLVSVLAGWGGEMTPIHALYAGQGRASAKVRAFIDRMDQTLDVEALQPGEPGA